jgi:hypothetical protein
VLLLLPLPPPLYNCYQHLSAHERGPASGHVHDARAGEVDDAAEDGIVVLRREAAVGVPHPVRHDRVDLVRVRSGLGQD